MSQRFLKIFALIFLVTLPPLVFQNCSGNDTQTGLVIPYGGGFGGISPSPSASASSSATLPVAIQTSCTQPTAATAGSYTLTQNLTYETIDSTAVELDLYVPTSVSSPPLIVQIHGGGWTAGDKADADQTNNAEVLVAQGYAVAGINYRLVSGATNQFPAAVQDARCAVEWLKQNATAYGFDATRVMAMGFAEGAYLAEMLGTAASVHGDFDNSQCDVVGETAAVNAVVAYYGLTNLTDQTGFTAGTNSNITTFFGASALTDSIVENSVSPVAYVSSETPPFFVAYGSLDTLVPINQAGDLISSLTSASINVNSTEVTGLSDGFMPFDPTVWSQAESSTCTLLSFLSAVASSQ